MQYRIVAIHRHGRAARQPPLSGIGCNIADEAFQPSVADNIQRRAGRAQRGQCGIAAALEQDGIEDIQAGPFQNPKLPSTGFRDDGRTVSIFVAWPLLARRKRNSDQPSRTFQTTSMRLIRTKSGLKVSQTAISSGALAPLDVSTTCPIAGCPRKCHAELIILRLK